MSVGGNDALGVAHLLHTTVRSVAEGLQTAVCTIYDTRHDEPGSSVVRSGLALVNDCITRAAFSRGLDVLDLRVLCADDADYANPIEPSAQGGAKIAGAIATWVASDAATGRAQVVC